MKQQEQGHSGIPADLMKNREAIGKLAQSGQAKRLVQLLDQSGGVKAAAQAAAAGKPEQLMAMMDRLMSTREGADLMEALSRQVKQAGLD